MGRPVDGLSQRAILTLFGAEARGFCALALDQQAPVLGTVDGPALEALALDLAQSLQSVGGLLVPGFDAPARAREEAAGRQLLDLFNHPGLRSVGRTLRSWLEQGARPTALDRLELCIDARSAAARQLPWELLERPDGQGPRVIRLLDGRPLPPIVPASHLEVLLWQADAGDGVCSEVANALRNTLSSLPRTRVLEPARNLEMPSTSPESFTVLHLICHGQAHMEQVLLNVSPERRLSPDAAVRWLSELLPRGGLVVLDVCEGGSARVALLDAPASRLVTAGAAVCVAPAQPLGADASIRFSEGFYRALAFSSTIEAAVTAGRLALRTYGLAHHTCRWWNPSLMVAGPQPLPIPLLPHPGLLPSHLTGTPDAERVLLHAARLGREQGYVGVEQLALALAAAPDSHPSLRALRPLLLTFGGTCGQEGFVPSGEPVATPRLRGMLSQLHAGYGVAELLELLLGLPALSTRLPPHLNNLQQRLLPAPGRSTVPLEGLLPQLPLVRLAAGLELEVLGGAWDGRRLRVGGLDESPRVPETTARGLADVELLKHHPVLTGLLFSATGWTQLPPGSRLERQGVSSVVEGWQPLEVGDVLVFEERIRLEVLALPSRTDLNPQGLGPAQASGQTGGAALQSESWPVDSPPPPCAI